MLGKAVSGEIVDFRERSPTRVGAAVVSNTRRLTLSLCDWRPAKSIASSERLMKGARSKGNDNSYPRRP